MAIITISKNRNRKDSHISLEYTKDNKWKVLGFDPINHDDIIGVTVDKKTVTRLNQRKRDFGTMDLQGTSPEGKILEKKIEENMGFSTLYSYVFLTAMGTYDSLQIEVDGITEKKAKDLLRGMGKKPE